MGTKKKNQLVSLSEQQLLDCSTNEGSAGCNGGFPSQAFQYILDNNGICSESDYTYTGVQNPYCEAMCNSVATLTGHTCVPPLNETYLLLAVTTQPIAVAIQANMPIFQHYTGGVLNDPSCGGDNVDHAVLIIGYGTDKATNQDYWYIKNSWGTGWGMSGFAMIARNKNQCGIAAQPVFPTINS